MVQKRMVTDLYGSMSGERILVCGYSGSLVDFPWTVLDSWLVIGVNDVPKIYMTDWRDYSDSGLAERY